MMPVPEIQFLTNTIAKSEPRLMTPGVQLNLSIVISVSTYLRRTFSFFLFGCPGPEGSVMSSVTRTNHWHVLPSVSHRKMDHHHLAAIG